jgi:hypothetical protein
MPVSARALPKEGASKGIESTLQKRCLRKDPDQRASWCRLCDSHGEIATQVSVACPFNETMSVFESDKAGISGYEVSTKQIGWNRSGVALDQRAILPTAPVVNRRSDHFLVPWHNSCSVFVARIEAIESDDDMNTAGRSQSTAEFLQILACRWAGKPTLSKAVRTSRSAAVKKC